MKALNSCLEEAACCFVGRCLTWQETGAAQNKAGPVVSKKEGLDRRGRASYSSDSYRAAGHMPSQISIAY